jgi:hypothetical protein
LADASLSSLDACVLADVATDDALLATTERLVATLFALEATSARLEMTVFDAF